MRDEARVGRFHQGQQAKPCTNRPDIKLQPACPGAPNRSLPSGGVHITVMSVAAGAQEAIKFRPRRLGHANLWVSDVDRNTEFYNKVLGLNLEATEPGILGSFLGNGNTHHDVGTVQITRGEDRLGRDGQVLIPKEISGDIGLFHLGWEMENESLLVDAIERLKKTDQPIGFFADHQNSHSIYIPDPDGYLHEFYADELKDWRSVLHGKMELITGVWNPGENPPHSDPRYDPDPELYGVKGAPLRPRYITHSTHVVSDFDKSLDFFGEVAGLNPIHIANDYSYANFQSGIGRYDLSIFQARNGEKAEMHHIGFELESEAALEDSIRALGEQGVEIEKQLDNDSKRSFFLLDPDKIRWEFFVDRTPDFAAITGADPTERPYLA